MGGRAYQINGECLVKVKGGAHLAPQLGGELAELGLASEGITITPRFVHQDIKVDDFGPEIPPEVMVHLADVRIRMTLVHYDWSVLDTCIAESMGGNAAGIFGSFAGVLAPAGTIMGNGLPYFASGWHYMSLNLLSPVLLIPWRFRACYLDSQPLEIPLSTQRTMAVCNWRAIPYSPLNQGRPSLSPSNSIPPQELISSGVVLWDHTPDLI